MKTRSKPYMQYIDRLFKLLTFLAALTIPLLAAGFLLQLFCGSFPAWREFGLQLLIGKEWNPGMNEFGALPAIVGTLLTTATAMILAVPPAFVIALYLVEAPPVVSGILSQALDLLAAIPSVIYGMWGLFVLVPVMNEYVLPFLVETLNLGKIPFVGEYYSGFGFLTAGVILALMIMPFISAVMRDVFKMTPSVLREAAFGIGCTRWETAVHIIMRYGIRGLLGGIFIGLGRALGETMAVLFVIGNVPALPESVLDCGTTISTTLANNFAEADGTMRSVLFALGMILLGISFTVQILSQYYLNLTSRNRGEKA